MAIPEEFLSKSLVNHSKPLVAYSELVSNDFFFWFYRFLLFTVGFDSFLIVFTESCVFLLIPIGFYFIILVSIGFLLIFVLTRQKRV